MRYLAVGLFLLLTASACGNEAIEATAGPDCQPSDNVSGGLGPSGDPNRRIEDIEFVLTGLRQTTDEDGNIGEMTDDPNFGGVWGDQEGGVVVAVVDCTQVDVDELARIAGGSDSIAVIEVPYTYRQVDDYRDLLAAELVDEGIRSEVPIRSTSSGRFIEVLVLDRDELPADFGASVPDDAYTVVETDRLAEEG